MQRPEPTQRDVTSRIELDVSEPADLVFAVAVSSHYGTDSDDAIDASAATQSSERLRVVSDGGETRVREVADEHGTRLHRVTAPAGRLVVEYEAHVGGDGTADEASESELLRYLRPSRYAESDALAPTAAAEFAGVENPEDVLAAVSSWVGTQLAYVPGSSGPTDGASRTLLERRGVCRDYAHLCIALLRARGIPARLAAVYAPGLDPMDFHAVAEAWVDNAWRVVDATTLAPRRSLVRIATGRDAADTAFLTIVSGRAALADMAVTAVADALPADDVTQLVTLR